MILNAIKDKRKAFKTVLIDSWYPTQRLMGLIDNSGKASHDTKKSENILVMVFLPTSAEYIVNNDLNQLSR
jgi:hypothetical protein